MITVVECDKLKEKILFFNFFFLQIKLGLGYAYSLPFSKEELEKGKLIYVVFTVAVCSWRKFVEKPHQCPQTENRDLVSCSCKTQEARAERVLRGKPPSCLAEQPWMAGWGTQAELVSTDASVHALQAAWHGASPSSCHLKRGLWNSGSPQCSPVKQAAAVPSVQVIRPCLNCLWHPGNESLLFFGPCDYKQPGLLNLLTFKDFQTEEEIRAETY